MPRFARSGRLFPALRLLVLGALGACQEKGRDLPTWTPQDHDNQAQPAPGQVDTKAERPGMPDLQKQGINDVVLATWKQSCTRCHGTIGRGDGPSAVSFRPPNFADPEWQRIAQDSEMERAISKGRGPMPAFAHLPPETVRGLVRLVRLMGARSGPGPESPRPPGAEGSAPPTTK